MNYQKLNSEQSKVNLNAKQLFESLEDLRLKRDSVRGSMHWKTINARQYLYRAYSYGKNSSLGARSAETEYIKQQFECNQKQYKQREVILLEKIKLHAAYIRANQLNRFPLSGARVLRALQQNKLPHRIIGTNALYVYEASAGVFFQSEYLATDDIDVLVNAQQGIKIASNLGEDTLLSLLQKTDKTFQLLSQSQYEYTAVNSVGYRIDFVTQGDKDSFQPDVFEEVLKQGDLKPVSIDSLKWCVSSPLYDAIVFDERGFPLRINTIDPRAFVIHKYFTSHQVDREVIKRRRDEEQAKLMAVVLDNELSHLALDPVIRRLFPKQLQNQVIDDFDQFSL